MIYPNSCIRLNICENGYFSVDDVLIPWKRGPFLFRFYSKDTNILKHVKFHEDHVRESNSVYGVLIMKFIIILRIMANSSLKGIIARQFRFCE